MPSTTFAVNNRAAVPVTFTLQSVSGTKAEYINTASSLQNPEAAVISHDLKPAGSLGTDRHSLSFKKVVTDANGVPAVVSASLTLSVPRSSVVTEVMTQDVAAFVSNYLTEVRVAALIDGITP